MKLYDFEAGYIDTFLDQLIGGSDRAKKEQFIRRDVIIVEGKALSQHSLIPGRTENDFFLLENQIQYRAYLYLQYYEVEKNGLPKRHYFQCETVKKFSGFVAANSDQVTVLCKETKKVYRNSELPVCKNCRAIFREKTSMELRGKSFHEFILDLEEQAGTKVSQVGKNGYTLNWQDISTAFRKRQHYTCEKCGVHITNRQDYQYMHVHHINRDKLDNRRANLQCLCIDCHANVDALHQRNFSAPEHQRAIRKFRVKYKNS